MKCPCGEPELPPHDYEQHDQVVELEWEATWDDNSEDAFGYPSAPELSWYDPQLGDPSYEGGRYYWDNDYLHHEGR